MEQMNLIISTVLIILGTFNIATLASPMKHYHPEFNSARKEYKDLYRLSIQRDQDGKNVESKDVIKSNEFTCPRLQQILAEIPKGDPKVAIGVENLSETPWTSPKSYFVENEGGSDRVLPDRVKSGEALLYEGHRKPNQDKKITNGIFTYYLPDIRKTIGVYFCIRATESSQTVNKWNVELLEGYKEADSDVYDKLSGSPLEGNNKWQQKPLDDRRFVVKGYMSDINQAMLSISITK